MARRHVRAGSLLRALIWAGHLALPLLGLWLLLSRPGADVRWEHHRAHLVLVAGTALVCTLLGLRLAGQARTRADARLLLVSLAFATSAGFLALHALATPGVLVEGRTAGFVIATPVGLLLAGGLMTLSAREWRGGADQVRRLRPVTAAVPASLVLWAVVSLAGLPPLDRVLQEEPRGALLAVAVTGGLLYAGTALRFWLLYLARPRVVLLSLVTACALLAEALVAVALGRSWQASWWLWHLLLLAAFGLVAYTARVQLGREGSAAGLFDGAALAETVAGLQAGHTAALEALVAAADRPDGESVDLDALASRVGERFALTERQTEVLARAAGALVGERAQIRRLGALVAVGRQSAVLQTEEDLVTGAMAVAGDAFAPDTLALGLLTGGELRWVGTPGDAATAAEALGGTAVEQGPRFVVPLLVKGHPSGVLELQRHTSGPLADRDRSLLESFAAGLSVAVENARIYRNLDGLFRSYLSPDVATALVADPARAALGGSTADVTVLFADLKGFTAYSEAHEPAEVVDLLNRYYAAAVPPVLAESGTVVQFVGDEIMAVFGAPVPDPEHPVRAARAALALQTAVASVAGDDPDLPRFRVGLNTGPALVGNIGAAQMRTFTAIGDTTNLGARIQAQAPVGGVLIGPTTRARLGDRAVVRDAGLFTFKGKTEPVQGWELLAVPG